jgi:outer membrane protein OmpA-like peptidoglycan-associated protein
MTTTVTATLRAGALGLALGGCLAALPAHASDPPPNQGQGSKQADIGVVTGLTVGALAAGPAGAVIGAGVGALIGDGYHRQAQASAALTQALNQSEAQRAALAHDVARLDSSLTAARAAGEQLDRTLQNADELALDVSFRTDDDSVTVQFMSPLLKLGALAASMPQARLQIAGYADPRGSDAWNDALSLRRAESVAAVLAAAGMPRERLTVEAHGKSESTCAAGDLDAYALERRVTVRLQIPSGAGQVASQVVGRD